MMKSRRLPALVAVLALALSACAGDADQDTGEGATDGMSRDSGISGSNGSEAAARERSADEAGDGGATDAGDGAPAATIASSAADAESSRLVAETGEVPDPTTESPEIQTFTFGRDIIFTADVILLVDDVVGTTERAAVAVGSVGGVVFGQNSQSDPEPRSTMTFKVPPAEFQNALTRLGELGTIQSQTVSAEDVTDRVVDLESRIQTAQASVDRLRGFLAGAGDMEAISRLEAQLLERETLLEQLRGQARTLESQVGLATIVLTIRQATRPEPAAGFEVAATAFAGHDAGAGCPGDDDLVIDEGQPFTVCWALTNTGDVHLDEIDLRDDRLGVDMADVTAVEGSLTEPTAPGTTLVLAYETTAARDHTLETRVRAVPVSEDGDRLGLGARTQTTSAALAVEPDDSLPGFGDSLRASGRLLAYLGSIAVLVIGATVPFLPVLILAAVAMWWTRRRRAVANL